MPLKPIPKSSKAFILPDEALYWPLALRRDDYPDEDHCIELGARLEALADRKNYWSQEYKDIADICGTWSWMSYETAQGADISTKEGLEQVVTEAYRCGALSACFHILNSAHTQETRETAAHLVALMLPTIRTIGLANAAQKIYLPTPENLCGLYGDATGILHTCDMPGSSRRIMCLLRDINIAWTMASIAWRTVYELDWGDHTEPEIREMAGSIAVYHHSLQTPLGLAFCSLLDFYGNKEPEGKLQETVLHLADLAGKVIHHINTPVI